jgi:dolichol-phosphate mannosyltransferase
VPHLSAVVPVYRAEACVGELTRRLTASLAEITEDFEIVYVDDGSGDGSWDAIAREAAADPRVRGLRLCRNFGQHHALTAGLDTADGDWVVILDCDLQDAPEQIQRLYAKATEGFDVVLARRVSRRHPFLERVTSRWFYRAFDWLAGTRSDPAIGSFRILSRKVVEAFRRMGEQQRFFGGMIQWLGFPTATVEVEHAPRHAGESTYTFLRRAALASNAMIAFSNKPLMLSVRLGFAIFLVSLAIAGRFAYLKLVYGITIEGWTSVIVSLYLLGGLIIMNLGLLGIYIGRIFDQAKQRPLYVVDATTFGDASRQAPGYPVAAIGRNRAPGITASSR